MRHRVLLAATAVVLSLLAPCRVEALVIDTFALPVGLLTQLFVRVGPAGDIFGGGTLDSVFNAAADTWEGIIGDNPNPNPITIAYGWGTLPSGVLAEAVGPAGPFPFPVILFNNDVFTHWFADPTPTDNSEFQHFEAPSADLGGGLINVGQDYSNPTGDAATLFATDLLTVALHEIEHALGFANLFNFANSQDVLRITAPRPFAGTVLPLDNQLSHILLLGTVMFPFIDYNVRKLPSDADILGLAQARNFTNFVLPGVAVAPEPAGTGLLILTALAAHRLGRRRHSRRVAAG